MDRRDFLKLLGVATGASVAAGCNLDRKSEKLIPYLVPPDDGLIPGEASYSASYCEECPAHCAVTARIRDGRPVKLDGTKGHPVNSALCMRGQAGLNRLYHTGRIRQPLMRDDSGKLAATTWPDAMARVAVAIASHPTGRTFLSGQTSGSMSDLIDTVCSRTNMERLPEYEAFSHAALRKANADIFGVAAVPEYNLAGVDFLLTVGADVIETFRNPVAFAAGLSQRVASDDHFAWFHAEPHTSLTGMQADHRLVVRPGTEPYLLAALLGAVRARRVFSDRNLERHLRAVPAVSVADAAAATGMDASTIDELAAALLSAHRPLIVTGGVSASGASGLDAARLTALLQAATAMVGRSVDFSSAVDQSRLGSRRDVDALMSKLHDGSVSTLLVMRCDPVGTLDDAGEFASAMDHAAFRIGVGDVLNATLERCDVVLPTAHALESWGDSVPRRGVVNATHPVFDPLFNVRSPGDVLLGVAEFAGAGRIADDYKSYLHANWVRAYGPAMAGRLDKRGWITPTVRRRTVALTSTTVRFRFPGVKRPAGDVLVVAPSIRTYDGRGSMLPLLNEIPDPLTTVTWDRWVSISEKSAAKLGVKDRDEIEITQEGGRAQKLPVRVQPGLPAGVFTVQKDVTELGGGYHEASGESDAVLAVTVRATGARVIIPILAGALGQHGRGVVPGSEPRHYHEGVPLGHGENGAGERKSHVNPADESFNPAPHYAEYRWSMAVDMDLCVGCGACVAACYLENNVPMTGREEHIKGREMSWIRVEPYYNDEGGADFVPTMCQHCDAAPCEPVCPVFATYHNPEGLNAQVYNRCVGTRYCSNNCPYKQRRFNWFAWNHRPEPLNLMVNPDVSLRGKGIMEKCSMCVHRIRKARDTATDQKRKIQEGDLTTACAQACPSEAIVFGNLLDKNSQVARWAHSPRSTRLLEELGTSPGIFYLKSKGHDDDA